MILVPFFNRINREESLSKHPYNTNLQEDVFHKLFPKSEIANFIAFALHQNINIVVEFVSIINQEPLVHQDLLDSFKESESSMHLQNFILYQVRCVQNKELWLPLGSSEDLCCSGTLYGAYLGFVERKGVKPPNIVSYAKFRQEFLPLLQSMLPMADAVVERRRIFNGKKCYGLINIELSSQPIEESSGSVDLTRYKKCLWWIHGQSADSEALSALSAEGGQSADSEALSALSADEARGKYQTVKKETFIKIKSLSKVIQTEVPPTLPEETPKVILLPLKEQVKSLFENNKVIALDTEYTTSQHNHLSQRKLAYIQLYFVKSNTVCIFTYKNNFSSFLLFFDWIILKDNICGGFYILEDLKTLWTHFKTEAPPANQILFRFIDFYALLKFIHGGFKNKNSLKEWAKRLFGETLSKDLQKTNWFERSLDNEVEKYLVNDVWVLRKLFGYLRYLDNPRNIWGYHLSWCNQFLSYFTASYFLDQVLIPLFLEISLRGISIDTPSFEISQKECKNNLTSDLLNLGMTKAVYNSSQKYDDFLRTQKTPIRAILDIWPKTGKENYLSRSKSKVAAELAKHARGPRVAARKKKKLPNG